MPKFIQSDEIQVNIKATKEFTDREEPRRAFWEKYNLMKRKMAEGNNYPIQVFTYYGFEGIGKTSLLHKLMEEVNQNNVDISNKKMYNEYTIKDKAIYQKKTEYPSQSGN